MTVIINNNKEYKKRPRFVIQRSSGNKIKHKKYNLQKC